MSAEEMRVENARTRTRAYELGLYEKALPDELSWEERLAYAREVGYDYLEMSVDESDERLARLHWSAAERREVVDAMERTGLPIRSMCLSAHRRFPLGSTDLDVRRRSLEIMDQALDLACDLGIRTIQLAGYDVYYEDGTAETRRRFGEGLRVCVAMAAARGVLLGFETMETPFMDTVVKAMVYVDEIASPYLGVYPDAGNLSNAACLYGTSVVEDLQSGVGRLIAMHLKPTKPGVYRDLFFDDEEQHVDFEAVTRCAWELGVRRYVTELWALGRPNWLENVRTAHAVARGLLEPLALGIEGNTRS